MQYNKFKYIFPQRAKKETTPKHLHNFENGEYLLMPNYTGTSCIVFSNGFDVMVYDHRKKILRDVSQDIAFRNLAPTGNWFVYTGIYCPKHKRKEINFGQDSFIVTDVLVWDGEYLTGSTFLERLELLEYGFDLKNHTPFENCFEQDDEMQNLIYYSEDFTTHLWTRSKINTTDIKGIFFAKYFHNDFAAIWKELAEGKYNGCILRKIKEELLESFTAHNNRNDMLLCREFNFFNFLK